MLFLHFFASFHFIRFSHPSKPAPSDLTIHSFIQIVMVGGCDWRFCSIAVGKKVGGALTKRSTIWLVRSGRSRGKPWQASEITS